MSISSTPTVASWSGFVTNFRSRLRIFMIFQSKIRLCSCESPRLSTSVTSKSVLMNVIRLKCWLSIPKTAIVGQLGLNKHPSTPSLHGRTVLVFCSARSPLCKAELMNSFWASSLRNFWKILPAEMSRLLSLQSKRIISKAISVCQPMKSSSQKPKLRSKS